MKYFFKIPPSIFNAYNLCPRQAWLMSRNLTADQDNLYIDIGRLIDEESYKREKKKIYLADSNAMVDMVTKQDGRYFIAEIKKSSATLKSGIFQLKYYLYLFYKRNINIDGVIKIPKEKKSIKVHLNEKDIRLIESKIDELNEILSREEAPQAKRLKICSKCGHNEFCWS